MASPASLLELPSEIVEEIVRTSAFSDICNLRLVAKEAAAKSSQASFKAFFAAKTVTLSLTDLHRFVTATQPGWLGCALEHLTIVGTPSAANNESSEPQEEEIIALLATAFEQVVANSRSGRLRTLNLTILGSTSKPSEQHWAYTYNWRRIWQCADDTAHVAASGLKASGLKIENLDAFGPVRRCALGSGRLQTLFDSLSQSHLKSLTLALSAYEIGYVASNKSDLDQNLERILDHSHSLEHLDLRWFRVDIPDPEDVESRDQPFSATLATLSMSSLSSLSLRGIGITSNDLLLFLTRHPQLRHLRLEELRLKRGKFDSVFAYITSHLELESLYLNDLAESTLIQFIGATGEKQFPHPGPPNWIERAGSETKEKIAYKLLKGRIKGSAKANNWARHRRHLYGPPE